MKRLILAPALAALFIAQGGCVPTSGGASSGNAAARLDQLEQQVQQLRSQVGQVEQVLPGQAEMWSQMQAMRQELNIVNGKLAELQGTGAVPLSERVSKLEATLQQITTELSSSAPSTASRPASLPPSSPPAGAASSGGGQAAYDAGIQAFDAKRYSDAVVQFQDFVSASPKHKLASNAYFWQGESYYQMKDYGRAALAYQQVIANYSGSAKTQSAMLKQGMALYYAGKKEGGIARLNELVSRYPNSPEASRAKKFIADNAG